MPEWFSISKNQLHRHLMEQVALALVEIFANGQHAERVVDRQLKSQRRWGARDRRFFAENVYSCVRWWRKIWFCLEIDEPVAITAEQGLQACAAQWILSGHEWPETIEISGVIPVKILARAEELSKEGSLSTISDAIRESIPDWMHEWGSRERGERWPAILKSLNRPAAVDLRVNTLKATREKLADLLRGQEISTELNAEIPTALSLVERKNIFASPSFQMGLFEVQDRGSQQIAPLLPIQPGWSVIDACAGGGGKTLHLAALSKNRAKILAMDIHEWKLRELRERATRNSATCIETRLITGDETIAALAQQADAVLLDVPCSGVGVLRRHPDSKWKLSPVEIENLQQLQHKILRDYSQMVKPGGFLLYATCSVMDSENQRQVRRFLAECTRPWKLIRELQIDPDQKSAGDGFFAALLQQS